VTFAFGDADARLYGMVRLALTGGRTADGVAVLFDGPEPVSVLVGSVPAEGFAVPGLETTVEAPLRRWNVAFADGANGFRLTFDAAGPPAELDVAEPAARAGGMTGYEQLCRVHGTVLARGRERAVRCAGQRGHMWGEPDWDRIDSTRTLGAWLDDGSGVVLCAVRRAGSPGHGAEASWAAVLGPSGSLRVDEPRLSTTYDAAGRRRRAGLELWIGEEDPYPERATGEVVCGTELDLGPLRLDCAFVSWRAGGRAGVGRYDVLRRA
jgi:hypothetical protein